MIALRHWEDHDRPLLDGFNTPEMTANLVRSETEEELAERHQRYLRRDLPSTMLVIECDDVPVGAIGYWEHTEDDGTTVWETGWSVLREHQRKGFAAAGLDAVLDILHADGRHPRVHAFPSVDNAASNALCRRGGFTLLGDIVFPFRGDDMHCNDWVHDV